ncbi:MAG: hypothetical protein HXY39_20580 [Chloroflexi bacterium]|nr:hypothetical protein [Chloroflexota bacterium]
MAVRSKPLGSAPQRPARPQPRQPAVAPRRAFAPYPIVEPPARAGVGAPAGLLMLAFGLPLWALGAKYTLDGVVIGLNLLAQFLELPARVAAPTGWWNLLLVPLGLIFSYVEANVRPNIRGGASQLVALLVLLALTHGIDVLTTYLGITAPSSLPPIVSQIINITWWSGYLAALILTYLPEMLIRGGWALLTE